MAQFVPHSHIYPQFTDKVSSFIHFPLEPWCEDYSFLNKAVADFEQGLDYILTDSIKTPELDTSLDDPDAITSSVSSGFLCLVSNISDTSKLQLASSSGLINCGTRLRSFSHHVSGYQDVNI